MVLRPLNVTFIVFLIIAIRNRLLKANRPAEALAVISALEDKPISDPEVRRTFHAIREAVEVEAPNDREKMTSKNSKFKVGEVSLKELFSGGRSQNFRRVTLGIVIQCFQQVFNFFKSSTTQKLIQVYTATIDYGNQPNHLLRCTKPI